MTEIHSYVEALMLAEESPREFAAGAVIFREGEPGAEMFIVKTGSVELKLGGTLVETVGRGGILGEMALIDPAPRSASAIAGPDCAVVAIGQETFSGLVKQVPGFAIEVMRVMARRLRQSNSSS